MKKITRALISVSDKTGIVEFSQKLHALGVEVLSTGGTADLLKKNGVPVIPVSDYTGFPEMMDGRIKTLHPRVHGAILGRRDNEDHMRAMRDHGMHPIDLVVINLYPFEETIARQGCPLEEAIENIDIGGPAMIRSAAKNFNDVAVVVRPRDYETVLGEMEKHQGAVTLPTRQQLSREAFALTARYDALIAGYLTERLEEGGAFPPVFVAPYKKVQDLRYGENPHQSAALYESPRPLPSDIVSARQLQGKELSFNNLIDLNAAWELVTEFESGAAVIIKHTNSCGAALGNDQRETFVKARETDPLSAFGGILGFNRAVTESTAREILKNFVEAVIAPGFDPSALELFASKKNIRLLEMSTARNPSPGKERDIHRIGGGLLVQDLDGITWDPAGLKVVTQKQPSEQEMEDLRFGWIVAKHVKSNAIIYARDGETVGIGAGQMSRVDSAKLAVEKACKPLEGCIMASDAFFPFRDSVDAAAQSGVSAIVQPGGSIRDEEVIQAANEHQIAMVFTGIRHFKH
ncbi:MAG: bifunctional phosphoribosylaminoimidazolecarboxamide formyltransferase/IMP cyclohydrolase [Nitrospinaceae bacterium]